MFNIFWFLLFVLVFGEGVDDLRYFLILLVIVLVFVVLVFV